MINKPVYATPTVRSVVVGLCVLRPLFSPVNMFVTQFKFCQQSVYLPPPPPPPPTFASTSISLRFFD